MHVAYEYYSITIIRIRYNITMIPIYSNILPEDFWFQWRATALFWVITQRIVAIPYRRFGTTYRSHLQGQEIQLFFLISWPMKIGGTGCPETSVRNYHYTLRNNPEERRSHLLCGRSLKYAVIEYWRISSVHWFFNWIRAQFEKHWIYIHGTYKPMCGSKHVAIYSKDLIAIFKKSCRRELHTHS